MKKILFVASEAVPFASSGGLGDVIGSLPVSLKENDESLDIRVIIPLFGSMDKVLRESLTFVAKTTVQLSWRNQYCGIYSCENNGVIYYFIDNEFYFKRNFLYGEFDDAERFAFFCKAVLEIIPIIGFFPDILHAHDWQSALSIIYLNKKYKEKKCYSDIKTVFTIHNIQYQGEYGFELLEDIFELSVYDADTVEYNSCINLLKGAVISCDMLTTVSPTYAKEILSPRFSHGLHFILEQNKGKLHGILNGIDRKYYNPEKDKELFANFSYNELNRKTIGKLELQKLLGLPVNKKTPIISIISRLVDHKGLDLVTLAAEDILKEDVQLVILGKGDYYFENFFYKLAERYPEKVVTKLEFNKELAKKFYAGADMFLMPSKSEPCGLAQMIASRYGTVPVVHETGGLYDSIKDIGWEDGGNGFTFSTYSAWDLLCTIKRAITLYHSEDEWTGLVKKVMQYDFSWKKSAKEYIKLYTQL
ncbi:MAG: starch synthase [Clostridiales bacterium GWF2_36_10]|nr:MAG: starch synthase [Clostridiales bacterium GWF2_36_10]HAN20531.1 glycogen synthase GlgA [Clostridiales bacterium]